MSKSYVTLEQHQCAVCGKEYDTGAILLDKRMKDRFEKHTVTGLGLCDEDQKHYDNGFIAVVEGVKQIDGVYRTGGLAHIRLEAAQEMFG